MKERFQFLLDTNICIFFLRGRKDVAECINFVGPDNCFISEITEFELKHGAELAFRKNGYDSRSELADFLDDITILPIKEAIDFAVEEAVRLRIQGTALDDHFDLLIGCTAVVNNMVLVTDNVKHFRNIKDINIVNWVER